MVQTSGSSHRKGGKYRSKDIRFYPGQDITYEAVIDVSDQPIHIFGRLPEGHTVSVFRVYDGKEECLEIPDIPVMCKDGCSPLQLFNEPSPECGTGRFIQDDIWLFYQGRYKLVYNSPDMDTVIPDDVFVWSKPDILVSKIGINLPLCGENACPPECTPEHVMQLECDCGPTHEPDCLKCETPLAYHHDPEKPCELAFFLWSKPAGSKCSDEGTWHRINFAEWLDSLGGLITEVSLTGDDVISGSIVITGPDDPDDCVGRKLAINLNIGCPPVTSDNIIETINGQYITTTKVWVCENGVPKLADLLFKCPDESGVVTVRSEGSELRSDKPVWTCDAEGNPIRSDLIIKCPTETGLITITPEGDQMRSDKPVWTCDESGNPVRSDIVIACPTEEGTIIIRSEGDEMRSDLAVWVCDASGNIKRKDIVLQCPPDDGQITLSEGELTAEWVWVCDASGKIVKKRLTYELPAICDLLARAPTTTSVPATANILYVDDQGGCGKAPLDVCCPENMLISTGAGIGSCFDVPAGSFTYITAYENPHATTIPVLRYVVTITNPYSNPVMLNGYFNHRLYRYNPSTGFDVQAIFVSGEESEVNVGTGLFPYFVANSGTPQLSSATSISAHILPKEDYGFNLFAEPDTTVHPTYGAFSMRNQVISNTHIVDTLAPGQSKTYWAYCRIEYARGQSKGVDSLYYQVKSHITLQESGS